MVHVFFSFTLIFPCCCWNFLEWGSTDSNLESSPPSEIESERSSGWVSFLAVVSFPGRLLPIKGIQSPSPWKRRRSEKERGRRCCLSSSFFVKWLQKWCSTRCRADGPMILLTPLPQFPLSCLSICSDEYVSFYFDISLLDFFWNIYFYNLIFIGQYWFPLLRFVYIVFCY